MNLAYRVYRALSSGLFLTMFPPFWVYSRLSGKYRDGLTQRLGCYPKKLLEAVSGFPRIWMHAASVGEVRVAEAVIRSLSFRVPSCTVILSTTTQYGQIHARETLQSQATCVYAPIDFIGSIQKALRTLNPDALVCLETEIWPNWLIQARRRGVKTAIVNGRISVRSVRTYLKIRPLMRETLRHTDVLSMISEADAQRIIHIGALPERVRVNGNAKYDLLLQHADPLIQINMMKLYHTAGDLPVFIAGSTRDSEEVIILDVYQKVRRMFPHALLIIAPRHVERSRDIRKMVLSRGLACQFRTELSSNHVQRTSPVVILDTIGELQHTYSIATVVFCGGSLVPLGGQNVLEAAVWGKPVLYGPSMEDFLDAKDLLNTFGGGIEVADRHELAHRVLYLLAHRDEARRIGVLAKKAVLSHQGAADRHAAVIQNLLR